MKPHLCLFLVASSATLACGGSAPVPVARSGQLVFEAQPGWVEDRSAGQAAFAPLARYSLPRADGDADEAVLSVHFFQGGGGSVEDNLARWISQFEQPDGRPSQEVARTSVEQRGELTLHRVEVSGTFVAEMPPGSGQRRNESNWRLLGAVVESPYGPYFVKLVGPDATVRHWKDSFESFLKTMRP